MGASGGCRLCLALSIAWIAGVAALGYVNWPHFPLDLSPLDPAMIEAYRGIVTRHLMAYGLVALGPPLAAWIVAKATVGKRR